MAEKHSINSVIPILQEVEIFKRIPSGVIRELAGKMIVSDYDENARVINQGDEGHSMYVILKGEVKIHDKEFVIAHTGEGNFFGEFSLLDDEPRSLSVTTIVPSTLGNISQADFYDVINSHPAILRDIIKVMLKRLRTQNQQIINQLREKQKELEELVRIRTLDLRQKNEDLERTLNELRRTQEQLVQQAKLASLGQITAGIAHEIQNPLNFINNFSSLSKELAEEVVTAQSKEEQTEILSDLKLNLTKIEEHGQRADKIVKGMLLHSRSTKGEVQPTDFSALADQSVNIARGSFSNTYPELEIEISKVLPSGLPLISIIPQEISRVLINIIDNALYAVNQRTKKSVKEYRPEVKVEVKNSNGFVSIIVWDNGIGIPAANMDKIFHPFFTTKPTGQGTGLGLSTGYEIVKSQGGEIKLESRENEFTVFTIEFPVK